MSQQEDAPEPPGDGQAGQILTFTAVTSAKSVCPSSAGMGSWGPDCPSPRVNVHTFDQTQEVAETVLWVS